MARPARQGPQGRPGAGRAAALEPTLTAVLRATTRADEALAERAAEEDVKETAPVSEFQEPAKPSTQARTKRSARELFTGLRGRRAPTRRGNFEPLRVNLLQAERAARSLAAPAREARPLTRSFIRQEPHGAADAFNFEARREKKARLVERKADLAPWLQTGYSSARALRKMPSKRWRRERLEPRTSRKRCEAANECEAEASGCAFALGLRRTPCLRRRWKKAFVWRKSPSRRRNPSNKIAFE